MRQDPASCPNCEAALPASGDYCPNCGQRRLGSDARSVRHLLTASINEVTSLDSRLWRSLGNLFGRPGALTRDYILGRRNQHISPLGLFVLANLVFFLAPSLSDFTLSLNDQYHLQIYSGWIQPWIDGVMQERGLSLAALDSVYQLRMIELAKVMVILHVPLLALVSYALGFRSRLHYADHVVACLHFFAFLMFYYALLRILVVPIISLIDLMLPFWDLPVWQIAVSLQFLYVPFMLSKAFDYPWWRAILSSLILIWCLWWVHVFYRFVQFLVSFATLPQAGS